MSSEKEETEEEKLPLKLVLFNNLLTYRVKNPLECYNKKLPKVTRGNCHDG